VSLKYGATAFIVLVGSFAASAFAAGGNDNAKSVVGIWQGELPVKANLDITIVFHVTRNSDGSLSGTMDVPMQQAKGIPVDSVSVDGSRMRIEVNRIHAAFDGQLGEDGMTATGR